MLVVAPLHLITPDVVDDDVVRRTEAALAAGAPWIQVRQKAAGDRRRLERLAHLLASCRSAGATCIANDRVDLALASGADGVHLGAEDLPVAIARRLLGPEAMVGATCRRPDDARRAADAGASYLGVGPAYVTTTKVGLPQPLGPRGIEAVARAVDLPVIAIGGISSARIPELLAAGAHGVAVVAAVYGAADAAAAVADLLHVLGWLPPDVTVTSGTSGTSGRSARAAAAASVPVAPGGASAAAT